MHVTVRMRSGHFYDIVQPGDPIAFGEVKETVDRIVGSEGQGVLVMEDVPRGRWLAFRTREIECVEIRMENDGSDGT